MKTREIIKPNLGIYLGMPPSQVPARGLIDCLNVRVLQGKIVRDNLGWGEFPNSDTPLNLDDLPTTLISSFRLRDGTIRTVFGNTRDLFAWDDDDQLVTYITPRYGTGTVTVTNGSPTIEGAGTAFLANVKAGDQFALGANEDDPAATWYEVLAVVDDDTLTLTANYAQATQAGQAYTIRSVFTGDENDFFFTEIFYGGTGFGSGTGDDRWYATNNVDRVVAWDGVATQVYRPDLGDVETCAYLRRDSNRMIFVAPTVSGAYKKFSIRTSDVGAPEDTVNGEAAELVVHDGDDELLLAMPIGDLLSIYGRRSITVAQYVGAPLFYAFRSVVPDAGPVSARAVADFPDHHYFISDDAQYIFDGTRAEVVNSHVWRDVARRIVPERVAQLHCWFDDTVGELLWAVPLTTDTAPEDGSPERAYVHHYLEDVDASRYPDPHTLREVPARVFGPFLRPESLTWDQMENEWDEYNIRWNDKFFFAKFPQSLFGDVSGNIFILNEQATQNGTIPVSYARFPRIALGTPKTKGVVTRIYPYIEQQPDSTQEVQVRLWTTNVFEGIAALVSDLAIAMGFGTSKNFVNPRKAARFAEVEIGTSASPAYWACSGYAMDTETGGDR
jgi:hypothetical protein